MIRRVRSGKADALNLSLGRKSFAEMEPDAKIGTGGVSCRARNAGRAYDVVVAGGGLAGCAAALQVVRRGKSALLLEKSNALGGLATLGLINLFVPMCNGLGKQICFGMAEEFLRDAISLGFDTLPPEWRDGEPAEPTRARLVSRFSPWIYALQLGEKLSAEGVDVLFDCAAAEPVMDGARARGVVALGKDGLRFHEARVVVDATGDADLLRAAGVPVRTRGNYHTWLAYLATLESCARAAEEGRIGAVYGGHYGAGTVNLYGDEQPADVPLWSGLTAENVSAYLLRNHRETLGKLRALAAERGRGTFDLAQIPLMPQLRTTACLDGDAVFRFGEDTVYRHEPDSICAIPDFEHRCHLFEVPYGTICRHDFPNFLTAGRSASAEGFGWDVLRVIPPAILTGQAAGEAAALALDAGCDVGSVPMPELQKRLESDRVMIHFPDSYIPEGRPFSFRGFTHGSAPGHF